jgi:hypothetical protein
MLQAFKTLKQEAKEAKEAVKHGRGGMGAGINSVSNADSVSNAESVSNTSPSKVRLHEESGCYAGCFDPSSQGGGKSKGKGKGKGRSRGRGRGKSSGAIPFYFPQSSTAGGGQGGGGAQEPAGGGDEEEGWCSLKTHSLGLHSSYASPLPTAAAPKNMRTTGEPSYTTGSQGTVDYIWHSHEGLVVEGHLEMAATEAIDPTMQATRRRWDYHRHRYCCMVDGEWVPEGQDMLPSYGWGSDHVSLVVQMHFSSESNDSNDSTSTTSTGSST